MPKPIRSYRQIAKIMKTSKSDVERGLNKVDRGLKEHDPAFERELANVLVFLATGEKIELSPEQIKSVIKTL
jgi:hypothetical protein